MKWIGALLVLSSALLFGNRLCAEKKQHIRLLRNLLECLELLQGELELRSPPIPELLLSLAEKSSGETGEFLRRVCCGMKRLGEDSFALIWSDAAEDCLSRLSQPEIDELRRLGPILGTLDLEAQLRALRFCGGILRGRLEEELRSYPLGRRLTLGLSVCAAAIIVILIL